MPLGKDSAGRTRGPSSAQRSINASRAAAVGPLREVVAHSTEVPFEAVHPDIEAGIIRVVRDVLVCGHAVRVATDLIGQRYPARRRCRFCGKGRAPHVDPEEYRDAS